MNVGMTRLTQDERRARSRAALLEAAARGLSRQGYTRLRLEDVAREAGYTRGALYHQFRDKEELALAALEWVGETWMREVGDPAREAGGPVEELMALSRGHAVLCRRDIARVAWALRAEFGAADHPIGRALDAATEGLVRRCARLVRAGRRAGAIPLGPPPRATALAVAGALEGAVTMLAGRQPHDEELAARAVAGILGL